MAARLDRKELYRLARLGAEARLTALEAERIAILGRFPDLAAVQAASASQPARRQTGRGGRRRHRMSAAARRAVSVRMKKYWANRRKSKSKNA